MAYVERAKDDMSARCETTSLQPLTHKAAFSGDLVDRCRGSTKPGRDGSLFLSRREA